MIKYNRHVLIRARPDGLGLEMCLEFPMKLISMITVVETSPQSKHFTAQDRIDNHLYLFYAKEENLEINTEGHEVEGNFACNF